MICEYCKRDPGTKPTGVWKGFKDADTNQFVCWKCKDRHYRVKFSNEDLKGLHSEMPVVDVPVQLNLQLF